MLAGIVKSFQTHKTLLTAAASDNILYTKGVLHAKTCRQVVANPCRHLKSWKVCDGASATSKIWHLLSVRSVVSHSIFRPCAAFFTYFSVRTHFMHLKILSVWNRRVGFGAHKNHTIQGMKWKQGDDGLKIQGTEFKYKERRTVEYLRKSYMVVIDPSYSSHSVCARGHTARPTTAQTSANSESPYCSQPHNSHRQYRVSNNISCSSLSLTAHYVPLRRRSLNDSAAVLWKCLYPVFTRLPRFKSIITSGDAACFFLFCFFSAVGAERPPQRQLGEHVCVG